MAGGLTTRGRAFLAGGLTAILSGIVLGEHDLVRIGLLAVLLPVVAGIWVALARQELRVERLLDRPVVEAGRAVSVRLTVHNAGRRTHPLLVEDLVPYALGVRQRFLVDPLPPGDEVELDYQVRSDLRGGFPIGPLRISVGDPFGLLQVPRTFPLVDQLVVTPPVEPLPPIPMRDTWAGAGEHRARSFTAGRAADVTVREYRTGDDLRRVHWRSSAHTGQLMVRREEQPWQARCSILVDNRAPAHRGRGAGSSLETAVRAAASVAVHLTGLGYRVRMVDASGEELGVADGEVSRNARALLARLALLPEVDFSALSTTWVSDTDSSLVVVLGDVTEHDRAFFARISRLGGAKYALALDVAAWLGEDSLPATAPWLQSLGWHAATVGPRSPLSRAWQGLAR
ncbi:MAG: DUF58 domain-containing protein [Marmoricola sp.]